ncbi:MAG TPA: hypothetical protein VES00_22595 [Burkholderiaceae bacterium]|nr:hypothetical protein [Burkholderiaceae bacterium]
MTARSTGTVGPWRRAARRLLAAAVVALPCAVHAQFAGTLGVTSVNRYRGVGTDDAGPVLRASAMLDLPAGAYGGVSGLWRTRDAGLASAQALLGWSGRLQALGGLETLSPEWGWDAALQRAHYGESSRYDFSEAMLGLLAPDLALRAWFAPHYFGGPTRTLYTELDASHALDARWRAFAHLGWLHYGPAPAYQARTADRVDTLAGMSYTLANWNLQLARDGLVAGHARDELDARRRRAAWILGASVAF